MGTLAYRALLGELAAGATAPPPLSEAMRAVLGNVSLRLREALVADVRPEPLAARTESEPGTTILYSGLARRCTDENHMRGLLRDCVAGHAAVVALLQHYAGRDILRGRDPIGDPASMAGSIPRSVFKFDRKDREASEVPFEACAATLQRIALVNGSRCRLVIGRQWYEHHIPAALRAEALTWRDAHHQRTPPEVVRQNSSHAGGWSAEDMPVANGDQCAPGLSTPTGDTAL